MPVKIDATICKTTLRTGTNGRRARIQPICRRCRDRWDCSEWPAVAHRVYRTES